MLGHAYLGRFAAFSWSNFTSTKACHKRTSGTQGWYIHAYPFEEFCCPFEHSCSCSKNFVACLNGCERRLFAVHYPFIFAHLDGRALVYIFPWKVTSCYLLLLYLESCLCQTIFCFPCVFEKGDLLYYERT